jgi:hypothetical protein
MHLQGNCVLQILVNFRRIAKEDWWKDEYDSGGIPENRSEVRKDELESTIWTAGTFGSSGVSTRMRIIRAHASERKLGNWRGFAEVEFVGRRWLVKSEAHPRRLLALRR